MHPRRATPAFDQLKSLSLLKAAPDGKKGPTYELISR
jgi:hypothetical protein